MKNWEKWFLEYGANQIKSYIDNQLTEFFFVEDMYEAFKQRIIEELTLTTDDTTKNSPMFKQMISEVNCACGWKGSRSELVKKGCITHADYWWECPACRETVRFRP